MGHVGSKSRSKHKIINFTTQGELTPIKYMTSKLGQGTVTIIYVDEKCPGIEIIGCDTLILPSGYTFNFSTSQAYNFVVWLRVD